MTDIVKKDVIDISLSLEQTKKVAKQLMEFVREHGLSVNIAGKDYMVVEGWEFAGSQLGLGNIVKNVEDISTEQEKKYKAHVEVIHLTTGNIVSSGFAVCSNKESKRRGADEYVISSMAQTRAIGKAYRNTLAWLVKAAGFEPTPVEEIDEDRMEKDLAKLKQKVVKKLTESGITEAEHMIRHIESVINKATIETVDEAYKVLESLKN